MEKGIDRANKFGNTLKVGCFLAKRQIKGSNKATTMLIIFIMMLTFLNLVVVSGILVGLIEGGKIANREQYSGDVIIKPLPGEQDIGRTFDITSTLLKMQGVENVSARYYEAGQIEANYKTRRDFDALQDLVSTQVTGINVEDEQNLSHIADYVVEGEFLNKNESGYIVIGS